MLAEIPYSVSAAAAGKHAILPTRTQEATLSGLSKGALMAELQLYPRRGQEASDILVVRGSHLSKLAEDFVAV